MELPSNIISIIPQCVPGFLSNSTKQAFCTQPAKFNCQFKYIHLKTGNDYIDVKNEFHEALRSAKNNIIPKYPENSTWGGLLIFIWSPEISGSDLFPD